MAIFPPQRPYNNDNSVDITSMPRNAENSQLDHPQHSCCESSSDPAMSPKLNRVFFWPSVRKPKHAFMNIPKDAITDSFVAVQTLLRFFGIGYFGKHIFVTCLRNTRRI